MPSSLSCSVGDLLQVLQAEGIIYMVLECGDIDLARLLAKHEQAQRQGHGVDEIDENFIRLYWQQMLQVWTQCNVALFVSHGAGIMLCTSMLLPPVHSGVHRMLYVSMPVPLSEVS